MKCISNSKWSRKNSILAFPLIVILFVVLFAAIASAKGSDESVMISYSNVDALEVYEKIDKTIVLTTLPRGEEIIVEKKEDAGYSKIACGNVRGYVKSDNITTPLQSTTFFNSKNARITAENVNQRARADMEAEIVSILKLDANVQVVGAVGDWVKVRTNNKNGYVYCDFIALEEDQNTSDKLYSELKMGVSGKSVVELQKALAKLELFTGEIDGIYDSRVREAVKQFQEKNKLNPDGKASESIQKMLFDNK